MHIDWTHVQKAVEGVAILSWEHWLSQTEKVKAGSTYELVWNSMKWILSKLKKGDSNVPK
jgi:hypothetical protein